MEALIASVETGEDLETVIRSARELVPDLWDEIDTSHSSSASSSGLSAPPREGSSKDF